MMIAENDGSPIPQERSATISYDALTVPIPEDLSSEILVRLLQMGDDYRRNNSPHQAIEVYLELIEKYEETIEGHLARERLMAIADDYQKQGNSHQARALYERLIDPENV